MFKSISKLLGVCGGISLILANSFVFVAFAHVGGDDEAISSTEMEFFEATYEEGTAREELISEEELEKQLEQDEFLDRVKRELNLIKVDYKQLKNTLSDTEAVLDKVREDKLSLSLQLENLDHQIGVNTEELITVIAAIIEKENKILLIDEEIEMRELALEYQKRVLEDYMAIIYAEENEYFNYDENGEIDAAKLLLAEGSVGENLRELDYFDLLNESAQQIVDKLERLHKELKSYEDELERHKSNLKTLKLALTAEKAQLELKKESKKKLLQITKGQEEIYSQLVAQTLDQQEEMLSDIKSLNDSLAFIELKLEEEGLDFDPSEYEYLLDYKAQAIYNFHVENLGQVAGKFIWPITPKKGISAYFRDPGYVGVFGVQHSAVDLPAYQGTPMRAVADAVVYAANDNGYGYSSIILAHAGGLQTVYGHVSNIMVEEGQLVRQGQIIGLTGGMPGTKGAGYMTTGPHLHFEVLLNGNHVDPLSYLPLSELTEEQIEWLPEKYHKAWEKSLLETVRRIAIDSESEEE